MCLCVVVRERERTRERESARASATGNWFLIRCSSVVFGKGHCIDIILMTSFSGKGHQELTIRASCCRRRHAKPLKPCLACNTPCTCTRCIRIEFTEGMTNLTQKRTAHSLFCFVWIQVSETKTDTCTSTNFHTTIGHMTYYPNNGTSFVRTLETLFKVKGWVCK